MTGHAAPLVVMVRDKGSESRSPIPWQAILNVCGDEPIGLMAGAQGKGDKCEGQQQADLLFH